MTTGKRFHFQTSPTEGYAITVEPDGDTWRITDTIGADDGAFSWDEATRLAQQYMGSAAEIAEDNGDAGLAAAIRAGIPEGA